MLTNHQWGHSHDGIFTGNAQNRYILYMSLTITNLRLQKHLPGANELNSFSHTSMCNLFPNAEHVCYKSPRFVIVHLHATQCRTRLPSWLDTITRYLQMSLSKFGWSVSFIIGTNFSEILIKIQIFSFTKMHLKISSAKRRPFCPGGDELTACTRWSLEAWCQL